MTLKEIRKLHRATRDFMAMLDGHPTNMKVRNIEKKSIQDLTFADLELYSCVLGITLDTILSMLLSVEITESNLKSVFWEFHHNGGLNVSKTWKSLEGCSNQCSLPTLQKIANQKDKFGGVKLNWCWYKYTGEELINE